MPGVQSFNVQPAFAACARNRRRVSEPAFGIFLCTQTISKRWPGKGTAAPGESSAARTKFKSIPPPQ